MSKIEKEIQNQIDTKLSEVSKRKEENYKEISEKYFPKKEKVSKRKYIIILSSFSSVIVAAVLLFVFVVFPKNDNKIIYYEGNELSTESDYEELSSYFYSFNLKIKSDYTNEIRRYYDSLSNDTLFFKIDYNDGNVKSIIDFVVNQNYKIDISNLEYSIKYHDINVMYNYQCKMSNLNVNAFFEKNGQSIMIHSSMVSIDGSEQQFWDYIENIIIVN